MAFEPLKNPEATRDAIDDAEPCASDVPREQTRADRDRGAAQAQLNARARDAIIDGQ